MSVIRVHKNKNYTAMSNKLSKIKEQLRRKETTITQIDEILNELFGVTHDIVSNPDEFKEILREKFNGSIASNDKYFKLQNALLILQGNLKISNIIIEDTIKNESGEETNTVKFENIKSFAEYVKCFYTANIDYIQRVFEECKSSWL